MSAVLRIFIAVCGLICISAITYLLVKKKLSERNSMIWFGGSLLILILSFLPDILGVTARTLAIDYPPALLFLVSILILLFIILHHSIQISALNERLKELTQNTVINQLKCPEDEEETCRIKDSEFQIESWKVSNEWRK